MAGRAIPGCSSALEIMGSHTPALPRTATTFKMGYHRLMPSRKVGSEHNIVPLVSVSSLVII